MIFFFTFTAWRLSFLSVGIFFLGGFAWAWEPLRFSATQLKNPVFLATACWMIRIFLKDRRGDYQLSSRCTDAVLSRPPLLIAVWTSLVLMMVIWLSLHVFPVNKAYSDIPLVNMLLDGWTTRWDSAAYTAIVETGYYYNPHGQSYVPFFPLYPLACPRNTPTRT